MTQPLKQANFNRKDLAHRRLSVQNLSVTEGPHRMVTERTGNSRNHRVKQTGWELERALRGPTEDSEFRVAYLFFWTSGFRLSLDKTLTLYWVVFWQEPGNNISNRGLSRNASGNTAFEEFRASSSPQNHLFRKLKRKMPEEKSGYTPHSSLLWEINPLCFASITRGHVYLYVHPENL